MQPLLAISQNASHVSSRLAIAAIDGNLNEDDINQHLMLLRESSPLVTRFPEVKEALETFVEISEAVSLEYSIKAPTEKITHALTILGVEYQRLDGVIGKVLFELDSEKT
ncbi:MAG: hypothetical protein H7Y28_15460 [Rhodoferax sp.]|nr:hypothetical protein [Rhodoferax sp.]